MFLLSGALVTGCNNTEEEVEKVEAVCTYAYNPDATTLEWTAFKTNDKLPVKGGFNVISVESKEAKSAVEALKTIAFTIETNSVETNDAGRNEKVAKFFFETINTQQIKGSIKAIEKDGTAIIAISMNDISVDVKGTYTLIDDVFTFESSIDVSAWNALEGIAALNRECKDLHTGPDGKSKLWSEVALKLTTKLMTDCK